MDLILWLDSYSVGNEKIDEQHKALVKLINELFRSISAKDKDIQTQKIFLELYNYTINHFTNEERIMRENGYSKYEDHRIEHKVFTQKITDFKHDYQKGNTKITIELLNFLKDWLIKHIIGTDKKTFAEIQKRPLK